MTELQGFLSTTALLAIGLSATALFYMEHPHHEHRTYAAVCVGSLAVGIALVALLASGALF